MSEPGKFECLIRDAIYAVAIVGNLDRSEFELADLDRKTPLEEYRRRLAKRGMDLCGGIGIVGGLPRTVLEIEIPELILGALSRAFVQRIENAICRMERHQRN